MVIVGFVVLVCCVCGFIVLTSWRNFKGAKGEKRWVFEKVVDDGLRGWSGLFVDFMWVSVLCEGVTFGPLLIGQCG